MAGYDNMTFKDAFKAARSNLGSGKTFTWKGKSYKTDTADGKQAAPSALAAAAGAPRVPNAGGKYSPTAETGFRSQTGSSAPMTSPKPKPRPMAAAAPAAPAPKPTMKPKPRPAELTAAMGGARRPNANGKYSPTEEMRLRKQGTSAFSKGGKVK